jgi:hypothetical protein
MGKKPYFAYSASLRIMEVPDKHSEITQVLGVEPDVCHKVGDVANEKTGRLWENNIWSVRSPLPETRDLDHHLKWLSKLVLPHEEYIRALMKEGADVDVFCGYRSDCDHCGFDVKPKSLELFVRLGVRMAVSVIVI